MKATKAAGTLRDLRHIRVCGDKASYCGHPRQGGIFNFGDGEICVIHKHAPCAYQRPEDIRHDHGGYHSRSVTLLQRSTDGGETWPESQNVVIYDESAPLERRRELLKKGREMNPADRVRFDMSSERSAIVFDRTWSGPENDRGVPGIIAFSLRSADKGRTWEEIPYVLDPPRGRQYVHKDGHPVVRFPDGTLMGAMTVASPSAVAVYGSDDDGLTWSFLSEVVREEPYGVAADGQVVVHSSARPTYAGLILLPSGELQCYTLNIEGRRNVIQMASSDDGYSWTPSRPIVRWGASPWAERLRKPRATPQDSFRFGHCFYRSPWPLRLRDGRILVLFARRNPPFGIGAVMSADDGRTWSDELVIRDDASGPDIGYPVATELDDGRIFTAYYYMVEDGNRFGGSRFIAGTVFSI